MTEGTLLDYAKGVPHEAMLRWHAGRPRPSTVLGIETGTVNTEDVIVHAVIGYRCPECGLLEMYAP
jgi:hypothetical protein